MLNILYLGSQAAADRDILSALSGSEFTLSKSICRTDRTAIQGRIAQDKPDVIILRGSSDAQDSGLVAELLHEIRESDSASRIVLLTDRHSRMVSYIALEYEVAWVLSTDTELDLLPKVLRRMDRRIQNVRQTQQEQEQRMFLDYIRDAQRLDGADRSLLFRDIQPGDQFQIAIVQVLAPYRKRTVLDQKNLLTLKGYDILMNRLKDLKGYIVARDNLSWIVCFRGSKEALERDRNQLKRFLKDMREFTQTISDCAAWVFLGSIETDSHAIGKSYRIAKSLISERILRPNFDMIEKKTEVAAAARKKEAYQVFDVKKAMVNSMETFDELMAHKTLEQLKSNILSATDFGGEDLFSIYKTLVSSLYQELERREVSFDGLGMSYEAEIQEYEHFWNINDVFQSLESGFLRGMNLLKDMEENSMAAPIVMAKRYIRSYFNMPLTLREISDYVGMNENYFSDCFSKATKMTFKQYQTDLRVRYAKQMLMDKQYSMEDVADAVGYNDVKYFSRVFKQVAGMAQGEYRKKYHVIRD